VRMEGLEPAYLSAPDPKSGVSTNFTTSAIISILKESRLTLERVCHTDSYRYHHIRNYFKNCSFT